MKRTSDYRFTVETRDDPRVAELRRSVKIINDCRVKDESASYDEYDRVVVRGRLGKNSPFRSLYARGGRLHRSSSQTIRPEHASRFDVYVNRVRRYRPAKVVPYVALEVDWDAVEILEREVSDQLGFLRRYVESRARELKLTQNQTDLVFTMAKKRESESH